MKKIVFLYFTIAISLITVVLIFQNQNQYQKIFSFNSIRVYTSEIKGYVQNINSPIEDLYTDTIFLSMISNQKISLSITNLYGEILYSNHTLSKNINLNEELYNDNYSIKNKIVRFSDVISTENRISYFIIYYIPLDTYKNITSSNPVSIYIAIFISLSFLFTLYIFLYVKIIFEPDVKKIVSKINAINYSNLSINKHICVNKILQPIESELNLIFNQIDYENRQRDLINVERKKLHEYISHDLKTPLAVIKGYIESIIDDIPTEEQTDEYNRNILYTVKNMEKLIQNLLSISMIEMNKNSVKLKEEYIDEKLEMICNSLSNYINIENKTIVQKTPYDKKLVKIDKIMFEQIIVNLISNSIKYSKNDSIIEVSTISDSESITIKVKDNGIGISKEELPFIFDKYYRAENAIKSAASGSGLGLAICKNNIEAMGGIIQVYSKKNIGAEFKIILPIA